jgi:hypothetical protein
VSPLPSLAPLPPLKNPSCPRCYCCRAIRLASLVRFDLEFVWALIC